MYFKVIDRNYYQIDNLFVSFYSIFKLRYRTCPFGAHLRELFYFNIPVKTMSSIFQNFFKEIFYFNFR